MEEGEVRPDKDTTLISTAPVVPSPVPAAMPVPSDDKRPKITKSFYSSSYDRVPKINFDAISKRRLPNSSNFEDFNKPKKILHRSKSDDYLNMATWDNPSLEEVRQRFLESFEKEQRAEISNMSSRVVLSPKLKRGNDFGYTQDSSEEEEHSEEEEETPTPPVQQLETREEDKLLIGLKPGGEEEILGGTWDALVEGLTSKRFGKIIWDQSTAQLQRTVGGIEGPPGTLLTPPFVKEFFFTYRYFGEQGKNGVSPAHALLAKLTNQYPLELAEETSPENLSLQGTIQLRIIGIIKHWMDNHFYDFEEDSTLFEHLIKFIVSTVVHESKNLGTKLWAKWIFKILNDKLIENAKKGKKEPALFALRTEIELQAPISIQVVNYFLQEAEFVFDYSSDHVRRAFSGMDAVEWISANLSAKENDAISICQQILNAGLITATSDKASVFSTNDLYFFVQRKLFSVKSGEFPKSVFPSKTEGLTFLDVSPLELARQIALSDYETLIQITPKELSHQAWSRSDAKKTSPHIINMIERFNNFSYWVATEIVTCPNFKNRVSILKRFICLADECKKVNDFGTMVAILVGLNHGAVTRLRETWKALPKSLSALASSLSDFIDASHNYRVYRTSYKAAFNNNQPIIPYLAVHLRDLTFIEDGNPNVRSNGMVNFEKMAMLSKVFSEIHECQTRPFRLQCVECIQKYLNELHIITDEKELYRYSSAVEGTMRSGTIGASSSQKHVHPSAESIFEKKKAENISPPSVAEESLVQLTHTPSQNQPVTRKFSLMNSLKKKKEKKSVAMKVVCVGDGMTGKTALCKMYLEREFPTQVYVSTLFETTEIKKEFDDYNVNLQLVDTGGPEDLIKSRITSYSYVDFVIICYSVVNSVSFKNITERWIPEINKYCPNAMLVCVGCKEDLVATTKNKIVTQEEGDQLCSRIGGLFHIQCSALEGKKVDEVFDKLLKIGIPILRKKRKKLKKTKSKGVH